MDSLGNALGVQQKSVKSQNINGEVHGRQIQDSNMRDATQGAQVAKTCKDIPWPKEWDSLE